MKNANIHREVVRAKARLRELAERRDERPGPVEVVTRHPLLLVAGSVVAGILLYQSPVARRSLQMAALYGLRNAGRRYLENVVAENRSAPQVPGPRRQGGR